MSLYDDLDDDPSSATQSQYERDRPSLSSNAPPYTTHTHTRARAFYLSLSLSVLLHSSLSGFIAAAAAASATAAATAATKAQTTAPSKAKPAAAPSAWGASASMLQPQLMLARKKQQLLKKRPQKPVRLHSFFTRLFSLLFLDPESVSKRCSGQAGHCNVSTATSHCSDGRRGAASRGAIHHDVGGTVPIHWQNTHSPSPFRTGKLSNTPTIHSIRTSTSRPKHALKQKTRQQLKQPRAHRRSTQ